MPAPSNALTHFQVIAQSRKLLKHIKLSSFATQRIKSQAQSVGVTRHLESIGKTRFSSICRAANSIIRNLPSIKTLVDGNVIFVTKKVRNGVSHDVSHVQQERDSFAFLRGRSAFTEYNDKLTQLVGVLEPFAKALKCIETAQIHPGHVWLFWLAALATLQCQLDDNTANLELPDDVIEQVISIINKRYGEMFEGPRGALYKAALFLDPGMLSPPVMCV